MADEPVVIEVPAVTQGDTNMADSVTDPANLSVALTAMANGVGNAQALAAAAFAASADRRTSAADQLASDSQRMWSIAMTTPTVNAGLGFRTATESGAGRTRLEANRPEETGAAAPAKVG